MTVYFGTPPKTPFVLPGTYITPTGPVSVGGPGTLGGIRTSPAKTGTPGVTTVTPVPTFKSSITGEIYFTEEEQKQAEKVFLNKLEQEKKMSIKKKEEIESRTLKGQSISSIEPFTPMGMLPSREELGAVPSFLSRTKKFLGSEFRALTNEMRPGDVSQFPIYSRKLATGFAIYTDLWGKPKPFGISGFPGFRKTDIVLKPQAEEAFEIGNLGTPAEFVSQDIASQISKKAQEEYEKEFGISQSNVDLGLTSIGFEKGRLKKIEEELSLKFEKEYESQFGEFLTRRKKAEDIFGRYQKLESLDIAPVFEGGAIAALSLTPGGQAAALGIGSAKAFSIPSRPEGEKLKTAFSAVSFGATGIGTFSTSFREIQTARAENLLKKSIGTPFKRGELKETLFEIPSGGGFSVVSGQRTRRFLEGRFEQDLKIFSPVLKKGDEFAFIGKAKSKIKLTMDPIAWEGQGSAIEKIKISQNFMPFGTTKGFPTQFENIKGFYGTTGINLPRGKFFGERIAGVSEKIGKRSFETISGDIKKFALNIERPPAFTKIGGKKIMIQEQLKTPEAIFEIGRGDVTLTKVYKLTGMKETFDVGFFGGVSKLKYNFDYKFKTAIKSQLKTSEGLSKVGIPKGFIPSVSLSPLKISPAKYISKQITASTSEKSISTAGVMGSLPKSFQNYGQKSFMKQTFSPSFKISARELVGTKVFFPSGYTSKLKSGSTSSFKYAISPKQLQPPFHGQPSKLKIKTVSLSINPYSYRSPGTSFKPSFEGFKKGFGFRPFAFKFPSSGGGFSLYGKAPRKQKRYEAKLRTSLTGQFLRVKGLPKPGKYGITPFQIRGLVDF